MAVQTFLSITAQELITGYKKSGSTESIVVGECLESIASNGGEMATNEHLAACADEICSAAENIARQLRGPARPIVNFADMEAFIESLQKASLENIVLNIANMFYSTPEFELDDPMDRDLEVSGADAVQEVSRILSKHNVVPAQGHDDETWVDAE